MIYIYHISFIIYHVYIYIYNISYIISYIYRIYIIYIYIFVILTYHIYIYIYIYLFILFAGLGWPDYRLFGRPLIENWKVKYWKIEHLNKQSFDSLNARTINNRKTQTSNTWISEQLKIGIMKTDTLKPYTIEDMHEWQIGNLNKSMSLRPDKGTIGIICLHARMHEVHKLEVGGRGDGP